MSVHLQNIQEKTLVLWQSPDLKDKLPRPTSFSGMGSEEKAEVKECGISLIKYINL